MPVVTKTNKEVAVAVAAPGEATIVVTRTIDASRELVWDAFTDPVHAGRWWGPDGRDWPNKITYREVIKPERLVYVHGDADAALFGTVVTFTADGARTKVHMVATFPSVAVRDKQAAEVGAVEGAAQHLDNMAAYVEAMS